MTRLDSDVLNRPNWNNFRSFCWRYIFIFIAFLTLAYIDNGCPGYITHYYSWRVVHGILCLVGLIGFTTFYFLFPETSQPGARGIEKMNASNGIDSPTFKFINPLEPLWLLRSPSMLLTVRFYAIKQRLGNKSLTASKGVIISVSQMAFFGEIH